MENFDKLFESTKNKRAPLNERKFVITDIKTTGGKKIYTILNDAKINIKEEIEKLFKKSDENRGVISNTVLEEMPNFIDLVARLERMPTFKDSFAGAEEDNVEPEVEPEVSPDDEYQDSMDDELDPDGDNAADLEDSEDDMEDDDE